jgi:xanthine dehydrogenase iron-sulfur cluster and FAD-binding subunit A
MGSQLHPVQQPGQHLTGYEAPVTIEAALALLALHGPRARPVAGGTDLLVELDRGARPGTGILVDLGRIPDLDTIEATADAIRLGPLVTHNQVVASDRCCTAVTPLAQACWEVGSPQLRNRATVAGNLVTASPANDTISALLALGASVELRSATATRRLPVQEFVTGFRTTALAPGELVTAIEVPSLGPDRRGIFVKLGLRRAQAISVVHLAVVVTLEPGATGSGSGSGTGSHSWARGEPPVVADAKLAIGSVAPQVLLIPAVAELLRGRPLDPGTIAAAAAAVAAAIEPIDDLRATAEYRREVSATMARRALTALAAGTQLTRWPVDPPRLWAPGFEGRYPTGAGHALSATADTIVTTTVNGYQVQGRGAPSATLLHWLRHHAGTNGVKEGCAEGECGACTVHLDGAAVLACLVPAGRANGADITTVEGLAPSVGVLHPVQEAFVACGAVQCGFCTPGLLMASAQLLAEHPSPSPAQVEAGLAGNLCRCTGYGAIHRALALAPEPAGTPVAVGDRGAAP